MADDHEDDEELEEGLPPGEKQEVRHAIALLRDRSAGWAERDAALVRLADLVRSGSLSLDSDELLRVLPRVAVQLPDLRSQIVRSACDLLTAIAEGVTNEEQVGALERPVRERIVPGLLLLAASANTVLAGFARVTLPPLANVVQSVPLLRLYAGELHKSKHVAVRSLCGRCVLEALRSWPAATLEGADSALEKALTHAAADAAQDVRSLARECLGEYAKALPESAERARSKLDASTLRALDRQTAGGGEPRPSPTRRRTAGAPKPGTSAQRHSTGTYATDGATVPDIAKRSASVPAPRPQRKSTPGNSRNASMLYPNNATPESGAYAGGVEAKRRSMAGVRSRSGARVRNRVGGDRADQATSAPRRIHQPRLTRVTAALDPEWERELQEAAMGDADATCALIEAARPLSTAGASLDAGLDNIGASLDAMPGSGGARRAAVARGHGILLAKSSPQASEVSLRAVEAEAEEMHRLNVEREARHREAARQAAATKHLALAALSEQADRELELQRGDPVRAEAARARARVDASLAVQQAARASKHRSQRPTIDRHISEVHQVLQQIEGELSVGALNALEETVLAELTKEEEELRESRRWWPGRTAGADSEAHNASASDDAEIDTVRAAIVLQAGRRAQRARQEVHALRELQAEELVQEADLSRTAGPSQAKEAKTAEIPEDTIAIDDEPPSPAQVGDDDGSNAAEKDDEHEADSGDKPSSRDANEGVSTEAPLPAESPPPRHSLPRRSRASSRTAGHGNTGGSASETSVQWQQPWWQQQPAAPMDWSSQAAAGWSPQAAAINQLNYTHHLQHVQQLQWLQAGISAALEMHRHNAASVYMLGAQRAMQDAAMAAPPLAGNLASMVPAPTGHAAMVGGLPAVHAPAHVRKAKTVGSASASLLPRPDHDYLNQMDSRQRRQLEKLSRASR